jgi:FAD/FMN-containing dehydrogenase/Fe-S oxidoreductase
MPARRPAAPSHHPTLERASPARYLTHPSAADVDLRGLEASLRQHVRGEVRFDAGTRGAYATDASNFRQVPLGVVCPIDVDDVIATVAACREHGAPVTHRGGGTSLAGEACNVAVVVDDSRHLDRILDVDAGARTARVQPGVVLDSLRTAANPHGLTFGPDPATHNRCTLGGMIGNNSCGAHSMLAGRTSDNIVDLDVLLYDGTRLTVGPTPPGELDRIVAAGGRTGRLYGDLRALVERCADDVRTRFPAIRRRVSGYNLDALLPENGFDLATALVGTEGTCVTVLGATLRLVPWPAHRVILALGYPDIVAAAAHVPAVLEHRPIACEAIGHAIATSAAADPRGRALLPGGSDYLLVEFGGASRQEARAAADGARRELIGGASGPSAALLDDPGEAAAVWGVREAALGTAALLRGTPPAWAGWEDAAVAPEALSSYLSGYLDLCGRFGFGDSALYGHFGDGCVHTRIPFEFATSDGVARYREFMSEAADLVVAHGGSLSGEHGDGQQRGPLLERMYGADLVEAFRSFQVAFDPDDRMNPGKVLDPVRTFGIDDNLRVDPEWKATIPTRMRLGADGHDLATATLRCVGMGVCRREGGGTMCPSFQVTREEEHSTRGRARLLFEMAEGEVVTDGWRSAEVADALDLCLSCKGCKHDCPVGVDMATYKAEFLHHHYRHRLRPRPAYSMGLISYAARLGSQVPGIVNAALHTPGVSTALKRAAGVHPHRDAPTFANPTFRRWFSRHARPAAGRRVIVFPDTFTNFFHPQVGRATLTVLEAAGMAPALPDRVLCCGRPLFDYGMLDTAAHLYRQLLRTLADDIAAGTPVVVPEPSCAASLRDELVAVLPDNPAARQLSGLTMTLAECLERYAPTWAPHVDADVLVQAHCHQRAVLGMDADQAVLDRAGARWSMPADFGCCGLAGSWGFEAEHHELSLDCGERALFPAVRSASPGTVLLADGFSCRTQIAQGTGRHAIHLAELLASGL